jgi:hypothetical protein
MVLWHVVDELLETSSNSADEVVILEITGNSRVTNEVESITDVKDWDRDRLRLDKLIDGHIDLIAFSWYKVDWCSLEQLVTLCIELLFRKSHQIHISKCAMLELFGCVFNLIVGCLLAQSLSFLFLQLG